MSVNATKISTHDTRAPLSVEHVCVKADRLRLQVRMRSNVAWYSTKKLADTLLELRPSLEAHTCINAHGPRFIDCLDTTSIPHILEHLIIDAQVQRHVVTNKSLPCDSPLLGTTEWIEREGGLARIEVNFYDDLIALAALDEALHLLAQACITTYSMAEPSEEGARR